MPELSPSAAPTGSPRFARARNGQNSLSFRKLGTADPSAPQIGTPAIPIADASQPRSCSDSISPPPEAIPGTPSLPIAQLSVLSTKAHPAPPALHKCSVHSDPSRLNSITSPVPCPLRSSICWYCLCLRQIGSFMRRLLLNL